MEDREEARISYRNDGANDISQRYKNDSVLKTFSIKMSFYKMPFYKISFYKCLSIKISHSSIKTVYKKAVYKNHPHIVSLN